MPGFDGEVRVLAIGDRLPSGFEDWHERLPGQIVVNRVDGNAIDAGADRVTWIDGVDWSCGVDAHRLRDQRQSTQEQEGEDT